MSTIYSVLKRGALTLLPDSILRLLRAWHYQRVLRKSGDVDEPDLVVVRKLVDRGTIAIDLGANIGIYTKVLSDLVGPDGIVISIEPIPQTFEVLSRNVRSLRMDNVLCVNAAISNSDGDVVMELPHYDTGGTNFYQAMVVPSAGKRLVESRRQVVVPGMKLDTLVAEMGTIGFVKCDVEGHELACLSGAEIVLGSHCPAWLIEVWGDPDKPGTSAMQLFRIFEGLSYVPWWLDRHRLVRRRPGDRSTNYFFLKEAHIAKLREKAPRFFIEACPSAVVTS